MPPPKPGAKLERGDRAIALCRELAVGELSEADLARKYDVSREAVRQFKNRHADQIADIKANLADKFAGIAMADPVKAAGVLSQRVFEMVDLLANPDTAARSGVQRAEMERVIASDIRTAIEIAGQLPSRMNVSVSGSLDLQINGVALDDLK